MEKEYTETQLAILNEIYQIVEKLGGDIYLLGNIGSIGDTLDDEECLQLLQMYRENMRVFMKAQLYPLF